MANSIDRIVLERKHIIENALNHPDIQKKLAAFTYDRKKLLEGKALNEKVGLLQAVKKDNYGLQVSSTESLKVNLADTKAIYHEHVALARLTYKDSRGMRYRLDLNGPRKRRKEEWLAQAAIFYSNIEVIAADMARYGVTLEVLQQTKAMIEALSTTRQQQLLRKAEAQNATEKRDAALKAMDIWMKDFKTVARLALKDHPQWLEMLGIKVVNQVK